MTRSHFTFACEGETLLATLDAGDSPIGLLIVSGGTEIRSGAFGWQARLAHRVAAQGHSVLRFDRRGIGDSTGVDPGFDQSGPDITAALAAFREHCPQLARIVAFGNCDAASALMLQGGAGCDALVLANPWTFDSEESAETPPEAIRARYASKLTNPRELGRLLRGEVDLRKLARGLLTASRKAAPPSGLLGLMAAGLIRHQGPVRFVIAERDRTGQAFRSTWSGNEPTTVIEDADHAFSSRAARASLEAEILSALHEQARQLDMG